MRNWIFLQVGVGVVVLVGVRMGLGVMSLVAMVMLSIRP